MYVGLVDLDRFYLCVSLERSLGVNNIATRRNRSLGSGLVWVLVD